MWRTMARVALWVTATIIGLLLLIAFWPLSKEWQWIILGAAIFMAAGIAIKNYGRRLENRHSEIMASLHRIERYMSSPKDPTLKSDRPTIERDALEDKVHAAVIAETVKLKRPLTFSEVVALRKRVHAKHGAA